MVCFSREEADALAVVMAELVERDDDAARGYRQMARGKSRVPVNAAVRAEADQLSHKLTRRAAALRRALERFRRA